SPSAAADVVNDTPWCCKIGELPTDQFPYLVGAASGRGVTAKRLPGPAAGDTARRPPTGGPDEGPRTRELDRQSTGIAGCCECDAARANCGRSSCCVEVDDVPADMVRRALHHWDRQQHRQRHNPTYKNPFRYSSHVCSPC